jgi:hypothetical protein
MSKSIRLSQKHGVNPMIPVCFFCGKEKNEIVLLGKLPNDAEAPRTAVIDYEPCDACRELMNNGVTIMQASTTPYSNGQPPLCKGAYPSGNFVILKPDENHKAGEKLLMLHDEFKKAFDNNNN